MKRTNIVIDEKLMKAGMRATGLKTRRALVDHALRELLRREECKKILAFEGKVRWEGDLCRPCAARGLSDGRSGYERMD